MVCLTSTFPSAMFWSPGPEVCRASASRSSLILSLKRSDNLFFPVGDGSSSEPGGLPSKGFLLA
ncbi:hypothetical protein OIU74_000998 [Salix koriyanagi]|uniref:Uncharacterized protein n=1 Tax=Salix koriyanagi TaxID=2511006 RepID=A0A9Q0X1E8_9ROSI|nr:hypothetical protein OIU74_000998 [Salix koriyanagi]